jgi:hypothetical protein
VLWSSLRRDFGVEQPCLSNGLVVLGPRKRVAGVVANQQTGAGFDLAKQPHVLSGARSGDWLGTNSAEDVEPILAPIVLARIVALPSSHQQSVLAYRDKPVIDDSQNEAFRIAVFVGKDFDHEIVRRSKYEMMWIDSFILIQSMFGRDNPHVVVAFRSCPSARRGCPGG